MSKQEDDRWFRPSLLTQDHDAPMGRSLGWIAPDSGDYHDLYVGIRPAFPHPITPAWLENALTTGVVPGREPWLEDDETAPLLRWRPRGLVESVKTLAGSAMFDLMATAHLPEYTAPPYFEKLVDLVVGLNLQDVSQLWIATMQVESAVNVVPAEVKRVILRALIDMKVPVPADTWRRIANDPDCQLSAFVALAKIDRDDALDLCRLLPDDPQVAEVVEHVCMFTWGGVGPRFKQRIKTERIDCKPLIRAALGGSL